jgi:hypothetical protein
MTSTVSSKRAISVVRSAPRTWSPTIGDIRPVTGGQIRLNGPRFPRKLSAYHEAAHAVVARALGCTVERLDISRATAQGGECVHVTPDTYRVPGSRRIRGTRLRRETTQQERTAMARRQRDTSTATAALAGVALEDIARAVPALDLLPAIETHNGTTLDGLQLRSRSDILTAAEAARRQHRTDAGRGQFFRRARARAARIMIANWPSLAALAGALLEHGRLDGQEVDRLLQQRRHNTASTVGGKAAAQGGRSGSPATTRDRSTAR